MSRSTEVFDQGFDTFQAMQSELTRAVLMPENELRVVIGAVVTGSHVLLEGVPGTGKTLLANSIATSIDGNFARVQGTPDKMPTDIVGQEIYRSNKFEFRRGPIFANVLLADEVNRMNAKTQSALLEAMQERQVTVGSQVYGLADPFIVLATQNPMELGQGVTPLTKANKDRFAVGLTMPPFSAQEMMTVGDMDYQTKVVASGEDILQIRDKVMPGIAVHNSVKQFAAEMVERVRTDETVIDAETVLHGARPYMSAVLVARTLAMSDNRQNVEQADMQTALQYVLPHRMRLTNHAVKDGVTPLRVVQDVINRAA